MKILILNSGSSSIKFQLLEMPEEKVITSGLIERIGDNSLIKIALKDGSKKTIDKAILNHTEGVNAILDLLSNEEYAFISNKSEIAAVGHRIVHGGESFSKSVIVDEIVLEKIKKCNALAPLHNPANVMGIKAAQDSLPEAIQCVTFDTAFHQTMPAKAFMYAIPYKYYQEDKIRKYGFHGSSHKFVSAEAAKFANIDYNNSKIIVCHLGNGASITAVKNGKSIDTTMGLTPLEGLIMGTRSGDLDLGAAIHIARTKNMSIDDLDKMLNKESGLLGITEGTADMRDIRDATSKGDERAKLALDMFTYRVKKYVGAYAAAMEGVDIIAFTGGIGENSDIVRYEVCKGLEFLGLEISEESCKNTNIDNYVISLSSSRVKAMVIQTDEEVVIARDAFNLINA